MNPKLVKFVNYKDNVKVVSEIKQLIEPSYKNAGSHLIHDIEACNELYTLYSLQNEMIAFFMVGYHKIENKDFCYLGLSTCRQDLKNSGYTKILYFEFAKDCIKKEVENNRRIICYWTTATPIVFHWTTKNYSEVQPNRKGECTDEGKTILATIAKSSYPHVHLNQDYPFILRRAAKQFNYSEDEKIRIKKATVDLDVHILDLHSIDENNGDRVLMFGYMPSHDMVIAILNSMSIKIMR